MPNRIIKESICTSPTLNKLIPEEEVFFYRLIVNCDDYGRMEANPRILRAKCFPLKIDEYNDDLVISWLQSLAFAELVKPYFVNGKLFLQINTWDRHQTIRAKKSKFPEPPNGLTQPLNLTEIKQHLQADVSKCKQTQANVSVIQSNPIQSNTPSGKAQKPSLLKETNKELEQSARLLRKYPETNIPLVRQVFSGLKTRRGYNSPKPNAEAVSINEMLKEYTPDQILKVWDTMKKDKFWQKQELLMSSVKTQIGAILKAEKPQQGAKYIPVN